MEIAFRVQLKILRPVAEVFEAVVDPERIGRYFVSHASDRLEAGRTVWWRFSEFPGEHEVRVEEVVQSERIVFTWDAEDGEYRTRVEMTFHTLGDGSTMVRVGESGWRETPAGVRASYDNCGGWMHMLCCLKAYLEHDLNLREGGAV